MKKLIAFLLACCMVFGYAAYAEETVPERIFLQGAAELLESIDLLRDMVRFDVGYLGKEIIHHAIHSQHDGCGQDGNYCGENRPDLGNQA